MALIECSSVFKQEMFISTGILSHSRRAISNFWILCGGSRWPLTHLPSYRTYALLGSCLENTLAIPFV